MGVDYGQCKSLNLELGQKYQQFQAPLEAGERVFLPTFVHKVQASETAYSIFNKHYAQLDQKARDQEMYYLLNLQNVNAEKLPQQYPLLLIQRNSLKPEEGVKREESYKPENNTDVEEYFKKYEKFAQEELDYLYENVYPGIQKEGRLSPKLFVDAAKKIYEQKKDVKYIAPIQLALAQLINEGFVEQGRVSGNAFNIGAHDSGVTEYERSLNTLEKGFSAYYSLLANAYLATKTADELLSAGNFTNAEGGAYALNPHYEVLACGHIGKMHRRRAGIKLSAGVGEGRENRHSDVQLVAKMLMNIGYLDKHKSYDIKDVKKAIQNFQKEEIVTIDKAWYKKRMETLYRLEFKRYGKDPSRVDGSGYKHALIQQARMSDGAVDPGGDVIDILYFMAYLNRSIPKL
ncbi:MAG: hypothetical protein HC880_10435 [Bacteroidia bacterium]|nr:hypothetical protein [Bacteroidia bacterium]